jgi:hypothetical protein
MTLKPWEKGLLYMLVALAVFLPLIFPFDVWENLPTEEVHGVYDTIQGLQPGDTIIIAVDFDPSSEPELYPMLLAVLRHAFNKGLYIIGVNFFNPAGIGLGTRAFTTVGDELGKVNGTDYCFLGYKPNMVAAIQAMNSNITDVFAVDAYQQPTDRLPIIQRTPRLRGSIKYLVDLAAGETVRPWVAFGATPGGYPMGAGCTAVSFADYFSLYQSGQINGLMGGLKAAAEYEELNFQNGLVEKKNKGAASAGMNSQSIVHVLLVLFILAGNVVYFTGRRKMLSQPGGGK